jgi:hypothetical protein
MSTRSKFIVAAAIAMLGFASPAFAQSFNRSDGTGNELPSYYDSHDTDLHSSASRFGDRISWRMSANGPKLTS